MKFMEMEEKPMEGRIELDIERLDSATFTDRIVDVYNWAMTNKSDPRTSQWFLMASPVPSLVITALYLIVVLLGPKWMANRPAFDLKPLLVGYNFFLVLLSGYMFYEFIASSFLLGRSKFSLVCQKIDYSNDPTAIRLASACWWYFFSKVIELIDTVCFVARKKNNQITFLHVYHHATMVILWWIAVRFVGGGEAYFSATVNCFIHLLMYTYYMLSACGPSVRRFLWWKKYMTKLQLLQFFIVVLHTLVATYVDCGFPKFYEWTLTIYMISHIILFSQFYRKTYHGMGIARDIRKCDEGAREHQNGFSVPNGICANEQNQLATNGIAAGDGAYIKKVN